VPREAHGLAGPEPGDHPQGLLDRSAARAHGGTGRPELARELAPTPNPATTRPGASSAIVVRAIGHDRGGAVRDDEDVHPDRDDLRRSGEDAQRGDATDDVAGVTAIVRAFG
jgi:hypothetical protein